MVKTNAMRKLDSMKIKYTVHDYSNTGAISGLEVADVLKQNPALVFKTLVTTGKSGLHYVFVIPVAEELDLKKAAALTGEKSVEMLKSKDLLGLTGYIHGGCSPVGMKKGFATYLHVTAADYDGIFVSGGKIGVQIQVAPDDLCRAIPFGYGDIIKNQAQFD